MKKHQLGFYLKQIVIENEKKINEELRRYGLTMSQVHVLKYLFKHCPQREVTQRDIEQHLQNTNPTVSGLLSRMEAKELITREESKVDARARSIQLTTKATSLNKKISRIFNDAIEQMLLGFTQEEETQLCAYIEKIRENIKELHYD